MIIGLIRHFKVDSPKTKSYLTAKDFAEAMEYYEIAPIIYNSTNIDLHKWEICYCSTIKRAVDTARFIYNGKIIYSDLITEVPIAPVTYRKIKLPTFIWHIMGRIAWYKNHYSQPESRNQTLERINVFMNEIEQSNHEKILIVTHGFFMKVFVEFLFKNGFKGRINLRPENGKLYLFEKS